MGRKRKVLIAALIAWPAWAQDYNPVLIAPQIIGSPQSMIPLNGGDDSTRLVQLPFAFEYFGQTFTSTWVSSNGFISFQSPSHLCCSGRPLEQAQRNTIYGYWTDLISSGNPYYRTDADGALFGWYDTREFGTNNRVTFEIGIFPDGGIQFNYGSLANSGRLVSAGITGPDPTDNVQLFLGSNVQPLAFQSGALNPVAAVVTPTAPAPFAPVPTAVPVMEPSAVPIPATVTVLEREVEVASVERAVEAAAEAIAETVTEQVALEPEPPSSAELVQVAADLEVEAAADLVVEREAEEPAEKEPVETKTAQDTPSESASLVAAPMPAAAAPAPAGATVAGKEPDQQSSAPRRRDRGIDAFAGAAIDADDVVSRETVMQVEFQNAAFLALADAQYVQQVLQGAGQQVAEQQVAEQQADAQPDARGTPSVASVQIAESQSTGSMPVAAANDMLSPATVIGNVTTSASQSQQVQILNMGNMQSGMAAGALTDVNDMSSADTEVMAQMATVPEGYGAYTQARLLDAPFYPPRDIYKNRRIPDQNMALYRMLRGQDALWNDMVDAQYER